MSSFEFNKILAAVILAIVVIAIIGKIGDIFMYFNKTELTETAYKIDIPEKNMSNNKTTSTTIDIEPILNLLKTASFEKGQKIFNKCSSCHNSEKNGKSKIGPNLWDLINQPKASTAGFPYSEALAEFGGVWSFEELNKFLYNPKEYIKNTKMNFVGLKKAQDRADLILWLSQNSDNPITFSQ